MRSILFIIIFFITTYVNTGFTAQEKRLDDQVNLLSPAKQAYIVKYHKLLLKNHDIDYHIAIVENTPDIAVTSQKMFSTANVGSFSKSGRGLLLLIDVKGKIRVHVSAALEPIYTDAFVAYIQNRQMAPFFAASRISDGILATTEMIFTRAQKAKKNEEFIPPIKNFATGAGAQTNANIGKGKDAVLPYKQTKTSFSQNKYSPLKIVNLYYKTMQNRDSRIDLPIYSIKTKAFLKNWVVTPAQMDNLSSTMQSCKQSRVFTSGSFAVVRYDINQRSCSPYFLHKENGNWVLDLATMSRAIRFNHRNAWHLNLQVNHPYMFAFKDIHLDKNGYAYELPKYKHKKMRWGYALKTDSRWRNFITEITPSSHIEKMGLKRGDQILTVNGKKFKYAKQFTKILYAMPPSSPVEFILLRNGQKMVIKGKAPAAK